MSETTFTQPVGFYRKSGVLRLELPRSTKNEDGKLIPPKFLMVDVASSIGPRKYDWESKITLGLNLLELGKIIQFAEPYLVRGIFPKPEEKLDLIHDPGMGTDTQGQVLKSFNISSTDDKWFTSLSAKTGEETKRVSVNMDSSEMRLVVEVCRAAIPKLLDW